MEFRAHKQNCLFIELIGADIKDQNNITRLGWTIMPLEGMRNLYQKVPNFSKPKKRMPLGENEQPNQQFYDQFFYDAEQYQVFYLQDFEKVSPKKVARLILPFYHYPVKLNFPFSELKFLP